MINWFAVICELQKNGVSARKIGRIIGCSNQTVCNWRDGQQPRYGDGKKLVDLWILITGRHENELPTIRD